MKKIIYTIVTYIISSAIFYSCSHESNHIQQQIEAAVNVMDEKPDSALSILDSINPSEIKSEKLFARYAIYLTQARYKNYIDETSDSLIKRAVNFYDANFSDGSIEKMLAHYYAGIIYTNAHKYALAIDNLIKSERIAKSMNQPLWLGRSQTGIARIYSKIFAFSEAVKYDSLACETFKANGDSINFWHRRLDFANSLNNAKRNAESLPISAEILSNAICRNDSFFIGQAYDLIARSHHWLKNYAEAVKYYNRCIELYPNKSTPDLYWLYIDALWRAGEHKVALNLIDSAKTKYGNNAEIPFEVLFETGNIHDAYYQLQDLYEIADSTLEEIIRHGVYNTVDEYHRNEIAKMELTHKNDVMKITALMLLIVIGGVAASLFVRHSRQEQKRSDERIMSLANELESILKEHDRNTSSANEPTETTTATNETAPQFSISRRHLDTIRVLCETYYESNQKESIKSRTAQDAEREIRNFVSTPDFHDFLEYLADTENGNIMKRFRQQMPGLSDKEYHIFVCSALHLPVPVILMFFDLNRNTLYTTRRRMRQKISDTHPTDEREFLTHL